jgi:hypothetical protein
MKTLVRIVTMAALIFTGQAFGQTAAPAQAKPGAGFTHPNLNGLERGEMKRRQMSASMAAQRITSDQKAVAAASAKVDAAKTSKEKTAAQAQLDQANKRLTADNKASTNAQGRVDDWNSSVLKSHHADAGKYKLDWANGQVAAK